MIPPKFCERGFDFIVVIGSQFRFLDLCFVGISSGYFGRGISFSLNQICVCNRKRTKYRIEIKTKAI